MDLEELIHNCKKGKRQAQSELYQRYSGVLFGMCLKYSRNKTEAEDNLHDSFMTIFNKIDQYSFQGSFEGWIKRITVNTVLQKYRKENHLNVVSEEIEDDAEVETDQADISLSTLLGYIQELPHKYRLTFNLYVLDGYSHKEISEMLGTSTGTSKSNLARAKTILREKIEKEKMNIA
ncbi:sigma-70 family RNA polymerase sigma factor [Flagellimonas taeanensis]|uniref:RNA polymerase sigma-70 factor, ECF subfamily n=1 Tax=Flagellimonas taeanensis TaxID=1005926 RepID=A0A1M6QHN2_9FLAO|nr:MULTISPECIES: sigma-70 family RNA polymerase sigma factor [Allomuricauda]MDC6385524.1 sigma-70 family RNA polymerase sigma factor [Muricauda sp. SK9]MEE1961670.1 sigma-70 family RNA polymerase sigma factor [Allomuricauda taeanensis]RIV52399.1 sigma-70 family RNA polymerase sigma factor [Allomuricauda taeanensis]SFB70915.1 RNA polymerase sigma-70 factor, ECF subfamily [Allomuricauda taeanensis]SHK19716.1 RNA polymerase sigma-70 factor, ECF subfamily [Allomuricauda taeanensis]